MTSSFASRQIARGAATVMGAIVLSQITSLLAKSLLARAFPVAEVDAFMAANRFSEILFNLLAGGALASAFIPTFTTALEQQTRAAAWRLASAIANILALVTLLVSLLALLLAPQVVRYILAPGFANDPAALALTVALLRVQLPSVIIFALSGLMMGILNTHQRFIFPALAPSLYALGQIFGILVLGPRLGIFGLAWGVVIGAGLHLLVQLPDLLRLPERLYGLTLGRGIPAVGEVFRLMAPRLLGVAAVQANFLVNTNLASLQPVGSLAGISLAFPIMYMPLAAIAQSVATAALPTFSAQVARGEHNAMRSSLAASLRGVLLLAVPASLGLILLRQPLAAFFYERGAFTSAETALVAWALLWYAAGLVGHSLVEIFSRAFYALHDTKTPVMMLVIAIALNIAFSLLFSAGFARLGWAPHGGLALANSLATALEAAGLSILMRRRLGGLEGRRILNGLGKALLAVLGMSLALVGWLALSAGWYCGVVALGGAALGGAVYFALLALLRTDELAQAWAYARRKLAPRK